MHILNRAFAKKASSIVAGLALAASVSLTTTPATAITDLVDSKTHVLNCAVLLAQDLFNGTSNHTPECGLNDFGSGAGGSNYDDGRNKQDCYYYVRFIKPGPKGRLQAMLH